MFANYEKACSHTALATYAFLSPGRHPCNLPLHPSHDVATPPQMRAAEEEKARALRKAEEAVRRLARETEAEAAALEAESAEGRASRLRAAKEAAEATAAEVEE